MTIKESLVYHSRLLTILLGLRTHISSVHFCVGFDSWFAMALSHLVRTLALNSLVTLEKDIVFSIICHLRANFQVTVLRPLLLFVCNVPVGTDNHESNDDVLESESEDEAEPEALHTQSHLEAQ